MPYLVTILTTSGGEQRPRVFSINEKAYAKQQRLLKRDLCCTMTAINQSLPQSVEQMIRRISFEDNSPSVYILEKHHSHESMWLVRSVARVIIQNQQVTFNKAGMLAYGRFEQTADGLQFTALRSNSTAPSPSRFTHTAAPAPTRPSSPRSVTEFPAGPVMQP